MKLRTAATFLFVAAIFVIIAELLRHVILYLEYGFDIFSLRSLMFTSARLLNALLFLLIAISYMGIRYNSGSRKMIGLFLAIFCGCRILLNGYSIAETDDMDIVHRVINVVYLLVLIPVMIIGIALSGERRRFTRGAMMAGMIAFGCTAAMVVYQAAEWYVKENDFGSKWVWMLMHLINLLCVSLPLTQFLWALAVYKQAGPDAMNADTSVIDQL
jgi:hypothetical protein